MANDIPKKLFVVMPHTSNMDGLLGILVKLGYGMELNFLAKSSLFIPPLGWLVRGLGGVPVDRSKNNRLVDQILALYDSRDRFGLVITPEATRSRVTKLRRGFYNISLQAEIPLICVSFDYQSKVVRFREPFYPTGNYEVDLVAMLAFYDGVVPRHPAKNSLPYLDILSQKHEK